MKVKLPNITEPVKLQVYAKTFANFDKNGIAEVSDLIGKILITKQSAHGYVEVKEEPKVEVKVEVKEEPKEIIKEKKIPKEPKTSPPPESEGVRTFLDEVKG